MNESLYNIHALSLMHVVNAPTSHVIQRIVKQPSAFIYPEESTHLMELCLKYLTSNDSKRTQLPWSVISKEMNDRNDALGMPYSKKEGKHVRKRFFSLIQAHKSKGTHGLGASVAKVSVNVSVNVSQHRHETMTSYTVYW
jgi:hypothetical protein